MDNYRNGDLDKRTDHKSDRSVKTTEEIKKQAQELGVDKRIVRSLAEMGFTRFTPIQEQTIPALLAGKDVIGQAQTGTGKTAAFGIPLLQNTDPECRDVQAIVLCPTRELAIQAAEELRKFAKYMHGIKILPVYGGQEIGRQIKALKAVQIIVGTPGRVMDHMRRHTLRLQTLRMVVLDEADEMLNMGFREDIEQILKDVPKERQTALFSATMPQPILDITHTYQKTDAEYVKVTPKELTIPLVKQYCYEVRHDTKKEVTARLLEYYAPTRSLIFCNTKKMVDELAKYLKEKGYQAEGLHGDLSQAQRDRVMNGFRGGTVNILIATDVAARGIDVDDVEAVFNYDVPQDIEYYVHRIGRTGRAGRTGKSFTLVTGRERSRLREIERFCNTRIEKGQLPSVGEVEHVKSEKILEQIRDIRREQDLTKAKELLREWMEREQMSAFDAATALLKLAMGEESEEIPEVVHSRDRRTNGVTHRAGKDQRRGTEANNRKKRSAGAEQKNQKKRSTEAEQKNQKKRSTEAEQKNRKKQSAETEQRVRRERGFGNGEKPKDVRTDGNAVSEKRRRHDHTGQRKKLITGENRDYGYDTDAYVYHRPDIHPGHTLEIKTKENPVQSAATGYQESGKQTSGQKTVAGKKNAKKSAFRFFKKK
ncbi:MAG: DEAD/DEAH box helicase [Lachnospiraceae bacterium]